MFTSSEARDRRGPGLFTFRRSLCIVIILLLVQGALALVLQGERHGALVDDAFISFRYAERWARGLGWTWNDGSRVEGFSNPLWTYGLGLAARAGVAPHRVAAPLGILAALATTALVFHAARRRGRSDLARFVASAGLALDVGLCVWAGSGLETALAALCVALLLVLTLEVGFDIRGGFLLGLTGAALVLARPEGFLWTLWTVIWLIWGAWAPVRTLVGFAIGLIPAAIVLGHRLMLTGSLLPNPFFAKLEPSTLGLHDAFLGLGGWMLAHGTWIALLLVAALWFRGPREPGSGPDRWALFLAGLVVGQGLFVLAAGGDWMGRTRYLVPVLPAVYLLGAEYLRSLPAVKGWGWVVALALTLHLSLGWVTRDRIPTYTLQGEALGKWLRHTALPGDTLATTASGAIPYFSQLPTLDVLGLNDPLVRYRSPRHRGAWAPGHHRYDIDRLLDQAPAWIVWDFGVSVNRHRIRTYRDWPGTDVEKLDYRRELFAHGKFLQCYEVDSSAPRETQGVYTVFRKKGQEETEKLR